MESAFSRQPYCLIFLSRSSSDTNRSWRVTVELVVLGLTSLRPVNGQDICTFHDSSCFLAAECCFALGVEC